MIISLVRQDQCNGSLVTCVFMYYRSSGLLPILSMVLVVVSWLLYLICSPDCRRDNLLNCQSSLFSFFSLLCTMYSYFFEFQIIILSATELTLSMSISNRRIISFEFFIH